MAKGGRNPEKKLQDAELKVMHIIWREGPISAGRISAICRDTIGWNPNTTYTLIKRCIEKGAVERTEPGYICRALITKEQTQLMETDRLIDKLFDGSADKLFAALLGHRQLSAKEVDKLKKMIEEME